MQMIFDSLAGIVKTIMIEQKIKIRDIPFDENKLAFEVDTTLQLFSAYFTPGKRYEFNHDSSIRKCEQPRISISNYCDSVLSNHESAYPHLKFYVLACFAHEIVHYIQLTYSEASNTTKEDSTSPGIWENIQIPDEYEAILWGHITFMTE